MKKYFAGIGLFGALLAVAGCGSSNHSVAGPSSSSDVSLESLRSAPTQVTVGSGSYALTAILYRNNQPTIVPTGSTATAAPLIASFKVAGVNSSTIPAGLTVTSAYVVENSTVGTFTNLSPTISSTINAASTMTIPAGSTDYAPGTTVEVVVQVQGADGTTYLLQAPSVKIGSVD